MNIINNLFYNNNIYHFNQYDWIHEEKNYKMIGISSTIGKTKFINNGKQIQLDQIVSRKIDGDKLILKINYSTGDKIENFGPICKYKKCINTIHTIEDHLGVERTDLSEDNNDICMHSDEGCKYIST